MMSINVIMAFLVFIDFNKIFSFDRVYQGFRQAFFDDLIKKGRVYQGFRQAYHVLMVRF